MSREELHVPKPGKDGLRRYAVDATNPRGYPEDTSRCAYQVARNHGRWTNFYQCRSKRGHGRDGLFCKIHTADAIKKREEAREKRARERWEREPVFKWARAIEENKRLQRENEKLKKRIEELEGKESTS